MKHKIILAVVFIFFLGLLSQASSYRWEEPPVIIGSTGNLTGVTGTAPVTSSGGLEPDIALSFLTRWLFNNGGSLDFNETRLNGTIDAKDTSSALWNQSGSNVFLSDLNNNVSIGGTSPGAKLVVWDSTDVTSTGGGALRIGGSDTKLIAIDNNEIQAISDGGAGTLFLNDDGGTVSVHSVTDGIFQVNTNDFYISAAGDIGIGTSTPNGKLSIQNVGSSDIVNLLTFSENEDPEFYFESGFVGTGSTGNFLKLNTFWTNNSMVWRGDGNVGIGTTAPVAPLEIQSTAASMRQTRYSTVSSQSAGITVQRSGGSTVGTDVVVEDGWRIANFNLRGYDGATYRTAASIQVLIDGTPGAGDMPGRLIFLTTADGSFSAIERMQIDSSGNVGIGTTSPNALLDVSGPVLINSSDNNGSLQVINESGDVHLFVNGSNGFIGFGTATPEHLFDVYYGGVQVMIMSTAGEVKFANDIHTLGGGTGSRRIRRVEGTATTPVYSFAGDTDSGYSWESANTLSLIAGAEQILRLSSSATNTEHVLLPISGSSTIGLSIQAASGQTADLQQWQNSSGDALVVVDSSGLVGIGTTTPSTLLDIAGLANATGYLVNGTLLEDTDTHLTEDEVRANATNHVNSSGWNTTGADTTTPSNVGIGTTSPGTLLHINGGNVELFRIDGGSQTGIQGFYNGGTAKGFIGYGEVGNIFSDALPQSFAIRAENALHLGTNGDNIRMTIDTAGDIGIGIINASSQLHLYVDNADTVDSFTIEQDGSGDATMEFLLTGLESYGVGIDNDDGDAFKIDNNGPEFGSAEFEIQADNDVILVKAGGNVGIGTDTPTNLLTVVGSGNIVNISSSTSGDANLYLEADTDNNNENDNPTFILRQDGDRVSGMVGLMGTTDLYTNANSNALYIEIEDTGGAADIQFVTGGTTIGGTDGTARMTIDQDGKVGINNTAPLAALHVNGTALFENGNVGIGTKGPGELLTVAGASSAENLISLAIDGEVEGRILFYDDDDKSGQQFVIAFGAGDQDLHFRSDDSATDILTLFNGGSISFPRITASTGDRSTLCVAIGGGSVTEDIAGNNCDTSSERYKHSIDRNLSLSGLDLVTQMQTVSFIKNSDLSLKTQYGLIAEDIAIIDPNLAYWEKFDSEKNITTHAKYDEVGAVPYSYSSKGIQAIMVKAIQEQQKQIEELKKEIQELKMRGT